MNSKLTIRIRSWDKYQAQRKNDRSWIKLQTQLIHDPDFCELSITDRYTWIGLLLHAGRVGPEFKLSLSQTRVLLKLNRNPTFEHLINQGFIEVDFPIEEKREEKNRRDIDTPPAMPAVVSEIMPNRFDEFWEAYPSKTGKKPCRAKWKARKLDRIAGLIIADVQSRIENDTRWIDGYIPNPLTYINQDRWEDAIRNRRSINQKESSGERLAREANEADPSVKITGQSVADFMFPDETENQNANE